MAKVISAPDAIVTFLYQAAPLALKNGWLPRLGDETECKKRSEDDHPGVELMVLHKDSKLKVVYSL